VPSSDGDAGGGPKAFGFSFDPAVAAIAVAAAVALYVLIFVLPTHPMYSPGKRLWYVYLGLSIATACLIYVDAENTNTKLEFEGVPTFTPLHWFGLVLVAWPIGFPLYFVSRSHFGQMMVVRAGLACAAGLVFLMLLSIIVIWARSRSVYQSSSTSGPLKMDGQTIRIPRTATRQGDVLVISSGTQVIYPH
jgi:hypothetical protein